MISIKPIAKVKGSMKVPGDKSISHRALMLLSIGTGQGKIRGLLNSADIFSTLRAFQSMGIEITEEEDAVAVTGKGLYGLQEPSDILDLGNSGTTMRLLSGILAGQPFMSVLTGDDSLRNRPMGRIIEPLREIGADIYGRSGNQKAPLVILKNPLKGGTYQGKIASAQVKSCLLLASLYQGGSFTYIEPQRTRDHTERMMRYLGISIEVEGTKILMGSPDEKQAPGSKKKEFINRDLEVPGDISSAAFFMALAAGKPGFEIIIESVGVNPTRTGIIKVIEDMGGDIAVLNKRSLSGEPVGDIRVRGKILKNIPIARERIPSLIDELPIIAVLASQARGDMEVSGAAELKVKESDRIAAMVQEMGKLGVKIEETPEGMKIYGEQVILGGKAYSHKDHRIAMSIVIAGLLSKEGVSLSGEECIDISFPEFFKKIQALREA